MHHLKSDVDRLYLPRPDGGRGLNQLEMAYETRLIGFGRNLETTTDPMLQAVLRLVAEIVFLGVELDERTSLSQYISKLTRFKIYIS